MSNRTNRMLSVCCVAVGCGVAAWAVQPEGKKDEPGKVDEQAMMEAWTKAMTPGKNHELLKRMNGEWTTTMKAFMGGPDQPPMTSSGKATISSIMGGRYSKQEYSGNMMGTEFQGLGITGFDNIRKLFVGSWVDSAGTGILTMTGGISPDEKTLTMFGQMDEPMTGEIGKTVKWVTEFKTADSFTFTAYEVLYGKEFVAFQIEYARAK